MRACMHVSPLVLYCACRSDVGSGSFHSILPNTYGTPAGTFDLFYKVRTQLYASHSHQLTAHVACGHTQRRPECGSGCWHAETRRVELGGRVQLTHELASCIRRRCHLGSVPRVEIRKAATRHDPNCQQLPQCTVSESRRLGSGVGRDRLLHSLQYLFFTLVGPLPAA